MIQFSVYVKAAGPNCVQQGPHCRYLSLPFGEEQYTDGANCAKSQFLRKRAGPGIVQADNQALTG